MMTKAIDPHLFQCALAQTYEPAYQSIIYGALKHLHVDYGHPLREDLAQEARLVMAAEMARLTASGDLLPATVLGPRLYRRISWRILDALRHDYRGQQLTINDPDAGYLTPDPRQDADINEGRCFLDQLADQLTGRQHEYLTWVMQDLPDAVIARRMGISKQAVANLRARVIAQGRRCLDGI